MHFDSHVGGVSCLGDPTLVDRQFQGHHAEPAWKRLVPKADHSDGSTRQSPDSGVQRSRAFPLAVGGMD